MSATIAFDTYAFVKKLKEAGMPEEQAGILAETHAELIEERLATKRDLREMETALTRDIKELELQLKHDLTIRFGGMLAVAVAVITVLDKVWK